MDAVCITKPFWWWDLRSNGASGEWGRRQEGALRQAEMKTRNGITVEASERLTSGGGSQLTLHTIRMRLYMKPDPMALTIQTSHPRPYNRISKKIDCQKLICNLSNAQRKIKRVQRQKCTYRVGEIQRNVSTATLPYQLFNALYKQS